jgi:hypothetical protein
MGPTLRKFDPKLEYIKGNDNIVADAISCLEYDKNINSTNGNPTEGLSVTCQNYFLTKRFSWYLANEECKLTDASEFENNARMMTLSCDTPYAKESKEQAIIKAIFVANSENADEIYLPTTREVADVQHTHRTFREYFKLGKRIKKRVQSISLKVVDETDVLVYNDTRLVILTLEIQLQIIQWYHHYLKHPGANRIKMTLKKIM